MHTTLIPAYRNDYQSEAEVREGWEAGRDFLIQSIGHPYDGKYINRADAAIEGGVFNIRYKGKTEVCVIEVAKP
tara:strand:- start:355 stop:576 length:222 start_codon:yes stop_codon:yes gene_type:complete